VRVLFLNEGVLEAGPMGHASVRTSVRDGLAGIEDVEATFISLPKLSGFARLATRGVPGLRSADLDVAPTRWHLVQAVRARRALLRILETTRADLLHVNSHSIAMALADLMGRIPTILSVDATVWDVRTMEIWRPLRPYSRAMIAPSLSFEGRSLRAAARIVVFSEWAHRAVKRIDAATRCVVLHPGIDVDRFRPAIRRPGRGTRVLFVGGRFEQKGGHDLLAAVAPLLGTHVEVDLVTQDNVPASDTVRVHPLSAGDPRLISLYQQADIFCMPTHADASPFAVLEAMACGLPIVSTPVAAIPEMLDQGRAGLLVRPGDRREIRAKIERLVAERALRAELGRRARRRVEERFDSRRQTVRLIGLMREAVAGWRQPGEVS
jgi:glycosyltransferase involved in cell wall biosynthesis